MHTEKWFQNICSIFQYPLYTLQSFAYPVKLCIIFFRFKPNYASKTKRNRQNKKASAKQKKLELVNFYAFQHKEKKMKSELILSTIGIIG